MLGLGFGMDEAILIDAFKYELPTSDISENCDGCHRPVLAPGRLLSTEGDTVVVTFLPKSA